MTETQYKSIGISAQRKKPAHCNQPFVCKDTQEQGKQTMSFLLVASITDTMHKDETSRQAGFHSYLISKYLTSTF